MKRISTRERNFLRVFSTSFRALKEYSSCCCSDFSSSPREFSLFLFNRIFTRRFSREFHDRKWPNEFYTKKLQRVADIFAVKLIYFCCWGAVDFLIFFSRSLSHSFLAFSHTHFFIQWILSSFIALFHRKLTLSSLDIDECKLRHNVQRKYAWKFYDFPIIEKNLDEERYLLTRQQDSNWVTHKRIEREKQNMRLYGSRALRRALHRTVQLHNTLDVSTHTIHPIHFISASLISQKQMIRKVAKSPWMSFVKKSVGVLFVAEAAAFGASYYLWYRLNTNQGELSWERFRENTLQLQSYLHSQTRDITVSSTIQPY